jgi:hypothetical protein
MNRTRIIAGTAAILLAGLCYFLGHRAGERESQRHVAKRNLSDALAFYSSGESGNWEALKRGLGMAVWEKTRTYESLWGEAAGTFSNSFARAQRIAHEVETNLVFFDPR